MNKSAMSGVVAVALLLVVAVISVVGFQSWFNTFSTSTLSGVESQGSGDVIASGVKTVISNQLYFNNGYNDNLTVSRVTIGGNDCQFTGSLSVGLQNLTLSNNCTQDLSSAVSEVVVYTDKGIFSSNLKVGSISSSSSGGSGSEFLSGYFIDYHFDNFTLGTFVNTTIEGTEDANLTLAYGTYKYTFNSNDNFVVPVGVTSITVKVWGAGGGSGTNNGDGGGGGFAKADITVTPGEILYVQVGGGGGGWVSDGVGGTNGGGTGGDGNSGSAPYYGRGGGGGGYSGIFRSSVSQANALIVAGGGGGGNGGYSYDDGGGGGGTTGYDGVTGAAICGKGGTQVAGGAGGSSTTSGQAGSALQGGNAGGNPSYSYGGGGGGAGYYGGGGGGSHYISADMGAGGGGSGYVTGTNTAMENGMNGTDGNNILPGGTTDEDWDSTAGIAGDHGADGNDGLVVIIINNSLYTSSGNFTSQIFNATASVNWTSITWNTDGVPFQKEIGNATGDGLGASSPYADTTGLVGLWHFNNGPSSIQQALNYNVEGNWDLINLYTGLSVIKDGSIYKMWYVGSDGVDMRILYTNSSNGKNWNAPVQSLNYNVEGNWDSDFISDPSVIKDENNIYHMWFAGFDGSNYRILYTNSSEGITWTTPISALNYNVEGNWDTVSVATPSVIKDGSTYKMWFGGYGQWDGAADHYSILYTTSNNGITWELPVQSLNYNLEGTWDTERVWYPSVIKDGSTYKMWYVGGDNSYVSRLLFTTSTDGITWATPVQFLDFNVEGIWDTKLISAPSVIKDGSTYKMWYIGRDTLTNKYHILFYNNSMITDSSGIGNNGMCLLGTSCPTLVLGKLGSGSLDFDNNTDKIFIPDNDLFTPPAMTLSYWIKSRSSFDNNNHYFVSKYQNPYGWISDIGSDGKLLFYLCSDATDCNPWLGRYYSQGSSYFDQNWHNIVNIWDGGTDASSFKIYVDGIRVDDGTTSGGTFTGLANDDSPVTIGSFSNNNAFNGTIDEVAIWNRTLSEEEIQNLYKRGAESLGIQVRSCDDAVCSGETFSSTYFSSPQTLNTTVTQGNQYFQYKALFSTDYALYSPKLFNVTINYTG